jgi:hypothetical protein
VAWTTAVLTGLAEHLAAAGHGTWRPTGVYAAGETGIAIGSVPATPDSVIVLTSYPVEESAPLDDVLLGVQIRCRAAGRDPHDVTDMDDEIRDTLHGARDLQLGPAPVALIWRASHARLGPDANGRHETTSNYYLRTARGSAHLTD